MLFFLAFSVLLILSLIISVTVHELGHLFFAIVTSSKIEEFHIGIGREVFSKSIVHIHLLPVSGHVVCRLNISNKKDVLKLIMVAIGGATFNCIMFVMCLLLEFGGASFVLAIVNLAMLFCSLLPIRGTDVYTILCEFGVISNEDE